MNKLTYWNGVAESLEDLATQIDDFGGPESHGCYPAAWAYATSTPFTYGKMVTSGGGCSTAAVICWPARIQDNGGHRRQFHHLIDVTPTILECAGVPEPTRVNGTDQMPMEGVSMLYTFDDAAAKDRHPTQYFELNGTRAIYHEGWWAGTRHGQDGVTMIESGFGVSVWFFQSGCSTEPSWRASRWTPTTSRPSWPAPGGRSTTPRPTSGRCRLDPSSSPGPAGPGRCWRPGGDQRRTPPLFRRTGVRI